MTTESFIQSVLGASVALLILFALIGIVLFVVTFTRTRNKKNTYANVHKNMAVGQRVLFAGGIYGTLMRVGKETCDVKIKSGEVMEVSRYAIQELDERAERA
ncbi:MAG: preprotein translocase subunit YajC [Atopobium sp.]|uniref:preprotein translocase subunit YajC n=1 Tax=Atopobium sp. TaxID=1872650 RepID=UPI002A74730C|nr:preprotein translocase subunit YajC [Atopobium sp.]MDY2788514.1 preprotein translocase subunit YajC [Atopobium sp.]